jgi:hypothetical protein
MRICGQNFSTELLDRIQHLIVVEPDLTRAEISRRVCDMVGWHGEDGRRKEMSCRKALLQLDRRGMIVLPAAREVSIGGTVRLAVDDGFVSPIIACSLAALGEVWLETVDQADAAGSRRWWSMMNAHHWLGAGPLCGAQLRYFIVTRSGIIGGLSFSAAAWTVGVRDQWIGWDDDGRRAGLSKVVCNSRFLILPGVKVPHLASHVLGKALRRLPGDWQARYGITPVLAETFTDPARHQGTCYRAANWQKVGRTEGRGRQDRDRKATRTVKEVWLQPLARNWRTVLQGRVPAAPVLDRTAANWAEVEFGGCKLGDARLTRRLVQLAQDFYARPTASVPQACGGDRAKTKAAYRLFGNTRADMQTLLEPHYLATEARMAAHKVVLAVQDTTSLNYTAHPATVGLGPVGNSIKAMGLHLHCTLAMTTDGTPLGFIDVQRWARQVEEFGKSKTSSKREIKEKESRKWLDSFEITCDVQDGLPNTTVVNIGDREADIFELFELALQKKTGPKLLVRASKNRRVLDEQKHLWPTLEAEPVAGVQVITVPRQGSRAAREAALSVRFKKVTLRRPAGRGKGDLSVWAVLAREDTAPDGVEPLEWMLLTTMPVESFEQAIEKLHWYARRWGIEVLHKILKSGCRIEDRQLGYADRLEACLAIDLVVAWRIFHLTKLGRETPDIPCTACFEDDEWKALVVYATKNPVPPPTPPTLREAVLLLACLGGFLARKGDKQPGTEVLWKGLPILDGIAEMWRVMTGKHRTQVPVSRTKYG